MGGDFHDVFGGVGGGGGEVGYDGFVEGFAIGIKDFGVAGLCGGEGVSEAEEGLGDGAGVGAGEANYAYASSAGWGGDGYDGVFVDGGGGHFVQGNAPDFFAWGKGRFLGDFSCSWMVFCGELMEKCVANVVC